VAGSGHARAYRAGASRTLRPIETEDRQARFNASQLDVVAPLCSQFFRVSFHAVSCAGLPGRVAQVVPFGS
jgi:hypothetical protein